MRKHHLYHQFHRQ